MYRFPGYFQRCSHKIRYLSKIADQIVVLVSSVHANAIVWNEQEITDKAEDSDDEADRLFTFEVVKTREQEENVTPLPGFEVRWHGYLQCATHKQPRRSEICPSTKLKSPKIPTSPPRCSLRNSSLVKRMSDS